MLGGREYYPDKTLPYLLPCDEQEAERLLLQHYVIRYAFGSNTIPPIDTTLAGKVLDCGCGPGTWVMEMATDYPDLDFYGFDISPMYPSSIHPRNAHFSVGNLLDPEIPYISDSFLLVHQRNMLLGLTQEAWPGVVQDLYRCVVPGGQGWLQLSEVDPIWARPGPVSRSFLKMLNETAQTRSVDILLPQRLDQVLKDVGCENVKMMMVEIPIGPWGGKIGVLWRDVLKAEMEALKPDVAVCGAEMTTSEEWDDMMVQVWAEMDQYHTYSRVYLAHGQKP
ncbi:S-adenosyl-L-methionine-dependent methyltransferase [Mortierella sp. GBAus27b]|nr:S-adenosyl-L-methionine-dependent methyltransferase [Mortierella sp. GBAus27b]